MNKEGEEGRKDRREKEEKKSTFGLQSTKLVRGKERKSKDHCLFSAQIISTVLKILF